MEEERPDVVVSPSVNLRFSEETDYFKAARHLGIPTVFCVLSWDNLTTKGVIPMAPDLTVVWNEAQKKEAVRIHGVPSGKILVAGSPFFEKWFGWGEEEPDRTAFCDKVGLAPDVPFVLYLGSSKNVAQDETWLVRKLAKRLRESPHAVLRTARILARPHPANARVFQSLVNGDNGICVWPRRPFAFEKGVPDSPATIRDFYCSLRLCIAAVGINTSGMLDAVVLDCPTIAVLTDRYRATQEATNHFQHLVGANAIATARGVDDCLRQLAEMADGQDSRRPQRMQFVSDFVRPLGPERSAAEVAAMGIILVAQGMPPEDIGKLLTQAGAVGSRQPPCSRTVEPSTG